MCIILTKALIIFLVLLCCVITSYIFGVNIGKWREQQKNNPPN